MVRRCCVPKCTGNSNEENKESVFRFPNKDEEKEAWRKAIPMTNLPTSNTTVVCERHWPPGYETTTAHGKVRPKNPRSVFDGLPASIWPSTPAKPRTTQRSNAAVRTHQPDELQKFIDIDRIKSFDELKSGIVNRGKNFLSRFHLNTFSANDDITIQSLEYVITTCIPKFLLQIHEDFSFTAYGLRTTMAVIAPSNHCQ